MALSTRYIIALQQIPRYGTKTVKAFADQSLYADIETIRDLYDFTNSLIEEGKIARIAKKLGYEDLEQAVNIADKILDLSLDYDIKAVSYLDKDFPKKLLSTVNEKGEPDVPIILYYKGDLSITNKKGIAIIGTREPTNEGLMAGEYYGKLFANNGYNIVSGLALGCDSAAHKGALTGDGLTTAFLANGLDTVFPSENTELAQQIVENGGLLMSENHIGKKANRYSLVERDRLQAALADATIVVQAGAKGGTFHAANATLLSNKPLFCVRYKGLNNHEKTEGNEILISKGAIPLKSTDALEQVNSAINDKYTEQGQIFINPVQKSLFD